MTEAKLGDTVRVNYTGKLEDGTIFDTSEKRGPIEFIIGEKRVIPGFEDSIVGMIPGAKNAFKINSDNAYGPYLKELVIEVDRKMLPTNIEPEVGQQLEIKHLDGSLSIVLIAKLSDASVTIDANHPLAGKDLFFDVELVEIK